MLKIKRILWIIGVLKMVGYNVQVHHSFDSLNKDSFIKTIERGFGRKLVPHYLEIANPEYILAIQSPAIQSPAIQSPAIQSPAIQSPAIQSPAIQSPAIQSPALDSYLGIAVVESFQSNIDYLDKIAVLPEYQGNGVGKALFEQLHFSSPNLFWRARTSNPANEWYGKNSDFSVQEGELRVYFKNIMAADINACLNYALTKPKTLSD